MTPLNHHHNDQYLKAHTASVGAELRTAFSKDSTSGWRAPRRMQGIVARAFVRVGVTMLPDTTDIVDDRIIILKEPIGKGSLPHTDLTRAA
jgi:hypothetical protein